MKRADAVSTSYLLLHHCLRLAHNRVLIHSKYHGGLPNHGLINILARWRVDLLHELRLNICLTNDLLFQLGSAFLLLFFELLLLALLLVLLLDEGLKESMMSVAIVLLHHIAFFLLLCLFLFINLISSCKLDLLI